MFITILMMFLDIVVRISSLSIPRVCPAISEDAAPRIPSAMYMGPGVLGSIARVPGSMFGDHGFWCVSQVYSFRKGRRWELETIEVEIYDQLSMEMR